MRWNEVEVIERREVRFVSSEREWPSQSRADISWAIGAAMEVVAN